MSPTLSPLPQLLSRIFRRYYPLICLLVLFVSPFVIHTYNYEPKDDAKRHVAKAVSGKSWPEILVMNGRFHYQDHNQGWHSFLGFVHRLGMSKESMLLSCTIGLFLIFMLSGFMIFRKFPECWLLSVFLSIFYVSPGRWLLGRPFILSSTSMLILLHLWTRKPCSDKNRFLFSVLLITLASWMHGAWYLFVLFPASLLLCGRCKDAMQAGICWLIGSFLAGILVGHPLQYLFFEVLQSLDSTRNTPLTRLLVDEFQPLLQNVPLLILALGSAAIVYRGKTRELIQTHPGFWLAALGGVLGIQNGRFWVDWGAVGLLYWVADSFRILYGKRVVPIPFQILICLGLYLGLTVDVQSRWSNSDFSDALTQEDPLQREWLPKPGGILYSDSMGVFYDTFYHNPQADWKYILGYEPVLMPAEDLKIYRDIQYFNHQNDALYIPWVDKMTPADCLILRRTKTNVPQIPQLEWKYLAYNTWSGKRPAAKP